MRKFKGKLTESEKVLKSVMGGWLGLVALGEKTRDIRKSKRGRTQRRGNVFKTLSSWMCILFGNTRARLCRTRNVTGREQ